MIIITDKKECCGCTACEQICPVHCISMNEDNEGFKYAKADAEKCINCGACDKVCPIKNHKKQVTFEKQAYLVQNKDAQILEESTSGGAFTAIAEYVIDKGGIVYGVEMTDDYIVRHIAVDNKEDLAKFRNSKYVQSDLGNSFSEVKEQLKSGRWVCFSGTPCQVEGLIQYLGRPYDNLILVDVVCRAVPSPGVWKKYIAAEIARRGKAISIRFRDKALGYQYSTMEITAIDGKTERGGIESQPWLRMFFSGMIIRPSCSECKFRSPYRKSDFTIWDCFPTYKYDKNWNEDAGTTRILIHTEKGKDLFQKIRNNFMVMELPVDEAISGVKEMALSPKENECKASFFNELEQRGIDAAIQKYFHETSKVRIKKDIRLFLNQHGLDKAVKHVLKKG